ncbi:hypothetical protein [Streptomyces sp. NPDC017941]
MAPPKFAVLAAFAVFIAFVVFVAFPVHTATRPAPLAMACPVDPRRRH